MSRPSDGKVMIVEGEDDKHAIVELMGHHTDWPHDKYKAPVWLDAIGSPDEILAQGFIRAKFHETGTRALGIVFDADEQFAARWQRVKQVCEKIFQSVPDNMPAGGLILENSDGVRLGVWMMPDNSNPGMLETFLEKLITARGQPLFSYAETVVVEARTKGAPCKECHIDKSEIHSWLSWQDPPGQALGRAITTMTLDPQAESAGAFVKWFLDLYGLKAKS